MQVPPPCGLRYVDVLRCNRVCATAVQVALGGLTILRDDVDEDVGTWRLHHGKAAVLAPHGPGGRQAFRHAASVLGADTTQLSRRTNCEDGRVHGSERTCKVVTFQWLVECVSLGKAVNPTRHPIFQPSHHELPLPTFAGFTLTFSQYNANSDERRLGIELIKLLGGGHMRASTNTLHPCMPKLYLAHATACA